MIILHVRLSGLSGQSGVVLVDYCKMVHKKVRVPIGSPGFLATLWVMVTASSLLEQLLYIKILHCIRTS